MCITPSFYKWRTRLVIYVAEHINEYKCIRHAGLSFDSLLASQEGLVSVQFLVTAPFRKQKHFSSRYMVQHLLTASTKTTRYALFSQRALSQPDSTLVTSQLSSLSLLPDACLELATCTWTIGCNTAWCGWNPNTYTASYKCRKSSDACMHQ